jgi:superfamily II DNA helicase RecQ
MHAHTFAPQEEVINASQSGRDVVAVMPTGAGKSLLFQLPATLDNKVTLGRWCERSCRVYL